MADYQTVKIERVVQQGVGLGRTQEGQVYYVPFSAPGDVVDVEVLSRERKLACLKKILVSSEDRVRPTCPYFERCGGCQLQHIRYEKQLEIKCDLFKDALERFGAIRLEAEPRVVPSPTEYGYRTRVRLKRGSKPWEIGYFAAHSRDLVPIERCPIAAPVISDWISQYVKDPNFQKQVERFDELEITAFPKEAKLVIAGRGGQLVYDCAKTAFLDGESGVIRADHLYDTHVYVSPGAFIQANDAINKAMVETVCDRLKIHGQSILELFSGNGNFTLPLARVCKHVTAVEVNGDAIGCAERSAQDLGLSQNIEFLHKGVLSALQQKMRQGFFEAVVLDPPRDGASLEVMNSILAYVPQKVLYVSCHPIRLAQELKVLLKKGRYQIAECIVFDQFPQTAHIEAMVLLRS